MAAVFGALGAAIAYHGGDAPDAYLIAESFWSRFAYFLVAVACGRSASRFRQAMAAALVLAFGGYAAGVAVNLVRGLAFPFGMTGYDAGEIVYFVLKVVVLPLAGVVLAFLTRREDLRGDLALALLLQGQSIPAVLSLQLWLQGLFTRESGECCVTVEWGYPWQDWAGLALALVLVVLLRPTPPARLRSLAVTVALTALLAGLGRLQGLM